MKILIRRGRGPLAWRPRISLRDGWLTIAWA
jgi:hypothetical protein